MAKAVVPVVGLDIANYKNAVCVKKVIDSVAELSVRGLGVAVDTGSTDDGDGAANGTLRQRDDSWIFFVGNGENAGQAAVTRAGLHHLDADFVCRVDDPVPVPKIGPALGRALKRDADPAPLRGRARLQAPFSGL